MDTVNSRPGVMIASASTVVDNERLRAEEEIRMAEELVDETLMMSSLASHISSIYQENKDVRQTSGIETKLLQSLRAYNGHYDPEDLAKIRATNGSEIYMNLTPTKCRAAMSWIRDILLPAKESAWSLSASPVPELPQEILERIEAETQKLVEGAAGNPQQGQDAAGAAAEIQKTNQFKVDFEEAMTNAIKTLADQQIKKFEHKIEDQLLEGGWDKALSDFIEDFCVFQVAIMKGPIVHKKPKVVWEGGVPVQTEEYAFLNKRVSPLDIYPSADATNINDGNLCEHVRFSRAELYNLIGTTGYKDENIRRVLNKGNSPVSINSYIEEEKTTEEFRGDSHRANKNIYHAVHYFGSASYQCLKDWGFPLEDLGDDEDREFEVEAILVSDEVIKCTINTDPLLRRPYYKASFQNIPGSWWGRSLPELMRDIQRMCNATARALSNNMAVAAGPQIEMYIDRIAADSDIESIYPFKIWQVTTDPTGAGGRAVQFWQPSSNAGELLSVYKEFEVRADDATGIPRYAYGNERTGAAAQTATGLSMLLESASKGIKDAIRHIDDGLIKPRVEYQFYINMLRDPDSKFTGDIVVIPKGSQALTMKGAQEMRRNEFLQIISNPMFAEIVGIEGFAEILREMSKSLGLGADIIPSRIELKQRQKQKQLAAQQAQEQEAQAKQQEQATGVQQVQMQTAQAEQASQRNAQLKAAELEQKERRNQGDLTLKAQELQIRREDSANRSTTALTKQQMQDSQKDRDTNKNVALSVESGFQDKSNQQ